MNREYNLERLLGEHIIVIPEMQRDYVWSITSDNVYKLLRNIDSSKQAKSNVGFIYAFRQGEYFSLIDGQQRLTTLVLMAFYLAVRDDRWDDFKRMIAPDGVLRFTYRVRKATVDFMNNLFLANRPSFDDIRSLSADKWGSDTTVDNIIEALHIIDRYVQMNILTGNETRLTYENVIRNVTFYYTDTDQTVQGREMYITMNCCGQPLSNHELLKPYLLKGENSIEKSTEWNRWEDWLYRLSKKIGIDKSFVDTAMNNFLRIVYELITSKQSDEKWETDAEYLLTYDVVKAYFEALERLYGYYPEMVKEIFKSTTNDGNRKYYRKPKALLQVCCLNPDNLEMELKRMYHLVTMCLRAKSMGNRDLLLFLRKYRESKMDLYSLIDSQPEDSTITSCIHKHEIRKIQIIKRGTKDTEQLLLRAEGIELFNTKYHYCLLNAIWDEKFSLELEDWSEKDDEELIKRMDTFEFLFKNKWQKLHHKYQSGYIDNAFLARYLLSMEKYDYYIQYNDYRFLGRNESWRDMLSNETSCNRISNMISNLFNEHNDDIFMVMKDFIDSAWKSYKGDHDARYYILKYENSLRAKADGWNKIWIQPIGDRKSWNSFNIGIYSKPQNWVGDTAMMFESLLAHAYYKGDNWDAVVNDEQFCLVNGIDRHGWKIYYNENMTRDSVAEYLRPLVESNPEAMSLSPANAEDDFVFIDIDKKHDLIEEGVSIMKHLEVMPENVTAK